MRIAYERIIEGYNKEKNEEIENRHKNIWLHEKNLLQGEIKRLQTELDTANELLMDSVIR